MRRVPPVVPELVVLVGPSDDGADMDVRVGVARRQPRGEALVAGDPPAEDLDGGDGRGAVVDAPRERAAEAHHVRHAHRVAPQDVVDLRRGERGDLVRGEARGAAADAVGDAPGLERLGVDGEHEGRRGGVLHVHRIAREEKPSCSTGHVEKMRGFGLLFRVQSEAGRYYVIYHELYVSAYCRCQA